jgi:hypothetical protein
MSQAEWWHNPRYGGDYARPQDAVAAGFKYVGLPVPGEQYLTVIAKQIDNDRQLLADLDTATSDPDKKHKPDVRKSALTRNKQKIAGVVAWCLEAIDDCERDAPDLLQATRRRKKPFDEFRYDPGEA